MDINELKFTRYRSADKWQQAHIAGDLYLFVTTEHNRTHPRYVFGYLKGGTQFESNDILSAQVYLTDVVQRFGLGRT